MASSSSASHPNHTPTFTYDVFLSFRGEDTRHTFTDHLYDALDRAGLRIFRDNDAIDKGQQLAPEIATAIKESRASIVVLSEKYADSRWCLDELSLILDQRRERNHFVLPIFYHVDPSDVRNQKGNFAIDGSIQRAIKKVARLTGFLKQESKWTDDNVRRWKAALTEVANLTGMELSRSRSEANFISEVVETIDCKVDVKKLSTPAHLIGMEARVEVIKSWLKNDQYSAIAICGMGGSGKTTLAQYIYNSNKQHFKSSSFIEVTGKQPDGLLGLQKQLLEDVGGKKRNIRSVSEGTQKIEEVLQYKDVLIVLDDIDQHEQLSALLGTKVIRTQSKIIITTRFLGIQAWFGSISWSCMVHKLNLLNDLESLELLSSHAFGSKIPMEGFKELAIQLAKYCGGNPLALKVLGSSLFVRNEDGMINTMREVWKSRMNSLNSLKGDLNCDIQCVLQKSFDSLPFQSHKDLFLHIACFFVGEDLDIVEMILEDELDTKSGIFNLVNKCLLTISHDRVMMHQLLQEMGRKVACDESKDAANRSRVWHDSESYHVLRKGNGSDKIEGLAINMQKVEQQMGSETSTLKTSSLARIKQLKWLQLKNVKLTGPYKNFPDLRWLCWHGCCLKTMPSGLLMSTLVVIDMTNGHLKKFEVPTVLNSLKYLRLQGCDKLVSISNLYRLPKLDTLILWNCSSLTRLCESIGDLESLLWLDMGGCTKMWKYVNQQETMMLSLPQSFKLLDLTNCDLDLNNDASVAFHARSLFELCLAVNPFEYLPSNIDFKMIRKLNLYCCTNLKSLPCIPSTLVELNIDWCTSLERVTFQSGRFSLQEFAYECCFKLSEIQGLFKLVPIAKIYEEDLGHMQWIKAYAYQKVDLVGDDITKGRIWHTQMLYEYGIMSTFLQGMKEQILTTHEYTSSSNNVSFRVPGHHEKYSIQGLNVSCLYRSTGSNDTDRWLLWAKISNRSKGLTWIYNPVVYCKPRVNEDVMWVSYWPIGNMLDGGNRVSVDIYVEEGTLIVSGCGVSLVYMDGVVDEEENCENNLMIEEEVIGGDLSEFKVTTDGYYLCRRDFFGPETLYWLKWMFGDNVHYEGSQGWRKTYQSMQSRVQREHVKNILKTIELGVGFNSDSEIDKIENAVYSLVGIESVSAHKEMGKLIVSGYVDPIEVATCVREFDNMVVILSVKLLLDKIE